jgi:putative oxidoreductase
MLPKLESYNDVTLLVARLFYSSLFILYGYFKLTAYAGTATYMAGKGLVPGDLFAVLAIVFELGGGLLMLVGYQTRCVALALAIYTLIAALIAHTHWADANQLTHFFKNMAIIGGSLAFVASGAGAYSLDRRRSA